MSKKTLTYIILGSLWVKAFWILHPDRVLDYRDIPVFKMFPFSDIEITKITYISYICDKSATLILIWAFIKLIPEYKWPLTAWFIIQALQFLEFFLNYNENTFAVFNLTFAKLFIPLGLLIYQDVWKDK